ncbi:phospholipase D-like domain-containing protein [Blastomonas sp.]|uniref:phospholipase D-like domain-containing protein n=1 Tax=Blastomonas sp. TaxID=1909299 RepID=UPI003593BD80
MRQRSSSNGVSVNAISGTNVVFLGFDVEEAGRDGLLGFAVHRQDKTESEEYWLRTFRTFAATDPNPPPGSLVSSQDHPVQAFSWGDYTAKPEHDSTYTAVPKYGTPENMTDGPAVSVDISTLSEDLGEHAIFFNRGAAGSQAYARKFGNIPPDKIADPSKQAEAWRWLSRGLEEAILAFIAQASSPEYSLRAAVYEFSYAPVLEALGKAGKVADVKIIYDRRKRGPWEASERAIEAAGIGDLMIPRTVGSAISHNKFIVLLHNGKPVEVWTGSTNLTAAGIFGQSNVGHIIRNEDVAQQFLDYWERLSKDPPIRQFAATNTAAQPNPVGEPAANGITVLFSPRNDLGALEWYGERMGAATQTLGFTAAFGISSALAPILLRESDFLRFIMVESEGSKRAAKPTPTNPSPRSQFDIFGDIRKVANNRIAVGSVLNMAGNDAVGGELHRWLKEELTGLNTHVKYLHTKYMFTDAITASPTVVSGSANFSAASTTNNDENMVIVHGSTDLADIFLGEFMRLFDHFYFRQTVAKQRMRGKAKVADTSFYLAPNDTWVASYYDPSSRKYLERKLFA